MESVREIEHAGGVVAAIGDGDVAGCRLDGDSLYGSAPTVIVLVIVACAEVDDIRAEEHADAGNDWQ